MSHLVLDSERSAHHRLAATIERNRERLRNAQREFFERDAAAKAGDGNRPLNTLEAAMGKPLHSNDIIKRLRSLNPGLYFEKSRATGRWGIYIHDSASVGTPDAPFVRYLGMSIGDGINPEFTPRLVNEKNELTSISAGYRTVLARLIRMGLVSEPQVIRAFGHPTWSSEKWKTATT